MNCENWNSRSEQCPIPGCENGRFCPFDDGRPGAYDRWHWQLVAASVFGGVVWVVIIYLAAMVAL